MSEQAVQSIGNSEAKNVGSSNGNKYLGFALGNELFGFELLSVREIIRLIQVTPIPRAPDYIRGIINLRGKIIPIVDLRTKFNLERKEDSDESCIIVVDVGESETGFVVDKVASVVAFEEGSIEDSPTFTSKDRTDYIRGIGKRESEVFLLLNIEKIMGDQDLTGVVDAYTDQVSAM